MNLPLPLETRDYLGTDKTEVLKSDNLGLLFSKFFYSWPDDWQAKEENNKEFRKDIESKFSSSKENDFLTALNIRQAKIAEGLQTPNYHAESFNATTDSRLIIGLGSESVIETGMTLHPLYGFPYLPGSGLKGLARAYAEIAEDFEDEKLKRELLNEIFGSDHKYPREAMMDNRQGKVFFMDGLPVSFPKLELDIMNPHYSEYYQGNKPPADYLNPVPVTFLTVAEGQAFSFSLYSRDKSLLKKAKEWLVGGLTELGAGGKTNVGYGYFRESNAESCSGQKPVKARAEEEDNSLTGRFNKLRLKCNQEEFAGFIKSISVDEIDTLKGISFKGIDAVNIGLAPSLDGLEVSPDVLRIIAEKMLEVIKPTKKWDEKKHEKYKKLKLLAGQEMEE